MSYNSLALGLQRGVNSICPQCIPWPVACSEWSACLTDFFDFRFWGKMTPKVKIFKNVFPDSATGHRSTFRDQIWWKSAVAKLPLPHKKNAGIVPVHILPKMARSRPKFPERWHPLTCPLIPNLIRIGCALPDLFRKDWFFGSNRLSAYKHTDNFTAFFSFIGLVLLYNIFQQPTQILSFVS